MSPEDKKATNISIYWKSAAPSWQRRHSMMAVADKQNLIKNDFRRAIRRIYFILLIVTLSCTCAKASEDSKQHESLPAVTRRYSKKETLTFQSNPGNIFCHSQQTVPSSYIEIQAQRKMQQHTSQQLGQRHEILSEDKYNAKISNGNQHNHFSSISQLKAQVAMPNTRERRNPKHKTKIQEEHQAITSEDGTSHKTLMNFHLRITREYKAGFGKIQEASSVFMLHSSRIVNAALCKHQTIDQRRCPTNCITKWGLANYQGTLHLSAFNNRPSVLVNSAAICIHKDNAESKQTKISKLSDTFWNSYCRPKISANEYPYYPGCALSHANHDLMVMGIFNLETCGTFQQGQNSTCSLVNAVVQIPSVAKQNKFQKNHQFISSAAKSCSNGYLPYLITVHFNSGTSIIYGINKQQLSKEVSSGNSGFCSKQKKLPGDESNERQQSFPIPQNIIVRLHQRAIKSSSAIGITQHQHCEGEVITAPLVYSPTEIKHSCNSRDSPTYCNPLYQPCVPTITVHLQHHQKLKPLSLDTCHVTPYHLIQSFIATTKHDSHKLLATPNSFSWMIDKSHYCDLHHLLTSRPIWKTLDGCLRHRHQSHQIWTWYTYEIISTHLIVGFTRTVNFFLH